ncbi:MAG: hypothetical protein WBN66_03110 [Smithella sp.]
MQELTRKKYHQKLTSAEKVAQMVKSGDRIFFGEFVLRPEAIDHALAQRVHELEDVHIDGVCITKAKNVVVEINKSLPHCLGGNQESVHISRVDYIVEGRNAPLQEIRPATPSEIDVQIAQHIMKEIEDGACLQLGIGGLPNVIGSMIAESDLKDLGV